MATEILCNSKTYAFLNTPNLVHFSNPDTMRLEGGDVSFLTNIRGLK